MSFAVVDLVGEMFLTVFGNPYIVAVILIGFTVMLLMAMRASIEVILIVIIPLIIGIALNSMTTDIINIPVWIILAMFMIAGIMFSGFILYLMR